MAVAVSAFVFALAHLMFWNWVAVVLTFGGGAIFAMAYLGRGGFALAVVLHAVAGRSCSPAGSAASSITARSDAEALRPPVLLALGR